MTQIEQFKQMLLDLPLGPEERAYYMTRVYENGGYLDDAVRSELVGTLQEIMDDQEERIRDIDFTLSEMQSDKTMADLEKLQAQYDAEMEAIRAQELDYAAEQAAIAAVDEKYRSMFAKYPL